MHKTFISYHHSGEQDLKDKLVEHANVGEDFIDKSVSDGDIDPSLSEETIMRKLREEFIKDSSVIVVLIGEQTANRPFVNSEIQAGLWDSPVGLIGVVRDDLYDRIYDKDLCSVPGCNCGITLRRRTSLFYEKVPFLIRENNAILENNKSAFPHYSDSEAYCGIYRYSNFFANVEEYVDEAFEKRNKLFDIKKTNDSDVQTINNTHG